MNDPRSMAIGWAALLFAAGTGYYFARKDLNERRREQARQGLRGPPKDWKEKIAQTSESQAGSEKASANAPAPGSSPVSSGMPSSSTSKPAKAPPEGS